VNAGFGAVNVGIRMYDVGCKMSDVGITGRFVFIGKNAKNKVEKYPCALSPFWGLG